MKWFLSSMMVLILTGCASRQLPVPNYVAKPSDDNRLRKDGYYQSSTDVGFEVIFTPSNKVIVLWGSYRLKIIADCNRFKELGEFRHFNKFSLFGSYTVNGDEILAYAPIYFTKRGMVKHLYYTNFKGKIDADGTIKDWQAVPPYPPELNERWLKYNFRRMQLRELSFIKNEAVYCLKEK